MTMPVDDTQWQATHPEDPSCLSRPIPSYDLGNLDDYLRVIVTAEAGTFNITLQGGVDVFPATVIGLHIECKGDVAQRLLSLNTERTAISRALKVGGPLRFNWHPAGMISSIVLEPKVMP